MQRIQKLPTVKQHHCKQTSVNLNCLTNETTVFVFIVDTRIALFAFEHSHSSDWLRPWCIFGEFLFSIPKLLKSIKSWSSIELSFRHILIETIQYLRQHSCIKQPMQSLFASMNCIVSSCCWWYDNGIDSSFIHRIQADNTKMEN